MTNISKRIALYCRVSTTDQSTGTQLEDLRRYARVKGLPIHAEYIDAGISGATAKRPALDRLMDDAKMRCFDTVLVWRFDRFARSTSHLLTALAEFRSLGIDFLSYHENLDTSTAMGSAMVTIVAAIAELERSIIRERVTAGVQRAMRTRKLAMRTWGRVPVEQAQPETLAKILQLRKDGLGYQRIGKAVGLSSATVRNVLKRQEDLAA